MKFIFEDLNFRGDNKDYHNPAIGFIDQVIERRKGLPISLSLVAMFIARRLELPIFELICLFTLCWHLWVKKKNSS